MDRSEWVRVPMNPPQMALDYLKVPEVGNWHGMLSLMPVPPKEAPPPPAEQASGEHVEVLREMRDTGDVSDWRAWDAALDAAIAALSQRPVAGELERALAESRAECERLMTIAGWGGLAADSPERLILASEMFDGIACCDKWQVVYRVGDDGQPMPESATAYVRADVADHHKARAERLAGALDDALEMMEMAGWHQDPAYQRIKAEHAALEQEPQE